MNLDIAAPATLPRLTASQAQALTLIAAHGADFTVTLPVQEGADAQAGVWRIGLTPGAPDALRRQADRSVRFEWAGAALRVCAPAGALAAWVSARVPELALGVLPDALLDAALDAAVAEVVAALAGVSPGGPLQVAPSDDAAPLPHVWTVAAHAQPAGSALLVVLEADDLGLLLLASLLARMPASAAGPVDIDGMPIRLRAEVGHARLPADVLQTLASGDVILLDDYLVSPQGELWLGFPGGQGVRVRAEQSSYLVTQGWTSLMTQTSPPDEDAPSGEPLDLDAIPVRLSFDLGDRSLSLAELRQLQPGAIFDLQRPLSDGPVMIRANGALIGTGSLVEVDGHVGVCIGTLGKGGA